MGNLVTGWVFKVAKDTPMTTNLRVGDRFPDFQLPNHRHELTQLSQFTKPSLMDEKLGFLDG